MSIKQTKKTKVTALVLGALASSGSAVFGANADSLASGASVPEVTPVAPVASGEELGAAVVDPAAVATVVVSAETIDSATSSELLKPISDKMLADAKVAYDALTVDAVPNEGVAKEELITNSDITTQPQSEKWKQALASYTAISDYNATDALDDDKINLKGLLPSYYQLQVAKARLDVEGIASSNDVTNIKTASDAVGIAQSVKDTASGFGADITKDQKQTAVDTITAQQTLVTPLKGALDQLVINATTEQVKANAAQAAAQAIQAQLLQDSKVQAVENLEASATEQDKQLASEGVTTTVIDNLIASIDSDVNALGEALVRITTAKTTVDGNVGTIATLLNEVNGLTAADEVVPAAPEAPAPDAATVAKLQADLASLQQAKATADAELATANAEIVGLRAIVAALPESADPAASAAQQKAVADAKAAIKADKDRIAALTKEVQDLKAAVAKAKAPAPAKAGAAVPATPDARPDWCKFELNESQFKGTPLNNKVAELVKPALTKAQVQAQMNNLTNVPIEKLNLVLSNLSALIVALKVEAVKKNGDRAAYDENSQKAITEKIDVLNTAWTKLIADVKVNLPIQGWADWAGSLGGWGVWAIPLMWPLAFFLAIVRVIGWLVSFVANVPLFLLWRATPQNHSFVKTS